MQGEGRGRGEGHTLAEKIRKYYTRKIFSLGTKSWEGRKNDYDGKKFLFMGREVCGGGRQNLSTEGSSLSF